MNISLITGTGFTIHSFEPGLIRIKEEGKQQKLDYTESLLLLPDKIHPNWTPTDFNCLLDFEPELILLGTGSELIFPDPILLEPIYAARVGIEVMSTEAACRTYNLLMSDNRRVLAALMI